MFGQLVKSPIFNVTEAYIPQPAAKNKIAIDWFDYHTLAAINGKEITNPKKWFEVAEIKEMLREAKIEHDEKNVEYRAPINRYIIDCTAKGKRQLFALLNPIYDRILASGTEEIFKKLPQLPKIIQEEGSLPRRDSSWISYPPAVEIVAEQIPYALRLTQAIFNLFLEEDVSLDQIYLLLIKFKIPDEYVRLNDVRNNFIIVIENLQQAQKKEEKATMAIVPY